MAARKSATVMSLRPCALLLLPLFLSACGSTPQGYGTLVFVNRHDVCAVQFVMDGAAAREVRPGRTLTLEDVPSGGHELVFTAIPETCVLYTRYQDSPLDSGRNLCNANVEVDAEARFTAVAVKRPGFEQVNVLCPD